MPAKTLSTPALSVIDQYIHLKAGSAVCSVPYFNNKTRRAKATLSVFVGKGSPKEIVEEIETLAFKNHIAMDAIADESLKKLLVDNNIGIDCSGFAYHVLNAESQERKKGVLEKHLVLAKNRGLMGKLLSSLQPAKNIDVATFADDKNSQIIPLQEIRPGDVITMLGSGDESDRDHILVIDHVEYQDALPSKIHYSHAVAYPEDGVYGSGVRQGTIEATSPGKSLLEEKWVENGKEAEANAILTRAKRSKTELRRLNAF